MELIRRALQPADGDLCAGRLASLAPGCMCLALGQDALERLLSQRGGAA